jgi:hypothetical protein
LGIHEKEEVFILRQTPLLQGIRMANVLQQRGFANAAVSANGDAAQRVAGDLVKDDLYLSFPPDKVRGGNGATTDERVS